MGGFFGLSGSSPFWEQTGYEKQFSLILTPNVTEYEWMSSVSEMDLTESTIAFGLLDPDFTDNEQKLPLASISTTEWIVNNPTFTLEWSSDVTLNLSKTFNGTMVSIGYNGIGMPYLEYFSFFTWLQEQVLDDSSDWLCSGSLGGYCQSSLNCSNYAAGGSQETISELMFTL